MNKDESSLPVPISAWILPALIHGVLALTVITRLILAGPRFARFYDDWKLMLPGVTEVFVNVSLWMENCFLPVMLALTAGLAIDALVLWLLGGWHRFEGSLWFFIGVAFLLITWGVMEVSFLMPYYKLQRALSR
jgi:type II secretory pathway component PulF